MLTVRSFALRLAQENDMGATEKAVRFSILAWMIGAVLVSATQDARPQAASKPIQTASVSASATSSTPVSVSSPSMTGKWKLNLAKSDFASGPKPGGVVIDVTSSSPEMVKWSTVYTAANGMSFTMNFAAPADGKDHPAEGTATTYAYTLDGSGITEVQKDTDGTVTTGTFTIKGKTGTWNYTIKDPQGTETHQVQVFDRVS